MVRAHRFTCAAVVARMTISRSVKDSVSRTPKSGVKFRGVSQTLRAYSIARRSLGVRLGTSSSAVTPCTPSSSACVMCFSQPRALNPMQKGHSTTNETVMRTNFSMRSSTWPSPCATSDSSTPMPIAERGYHASSFGGRRSSPVTRREIQSPARSRIGMRCGGAMYALMRPS